MKTIRWTLATLVAIGSVMTGSGAWAFNRVPSFKGNDTGGIISYSLYLEGADIKAMALDHCARYGKVVKLTGVQANYGGYISFACVWVPPGSAAATLRTAY